VLIEPGRAREDRLLFEEYRLLAEIGRTEGDRFWQRHSVYLVVTTGLIAALALAKPTANGNASNSLVAGALPAILFLQGVSSAGMLVSVAWLMTAISGHLWCSQWDKTMQEIENRLDMPTKIMLAAIPPLWSFMGMVRRTFTVRGWSFVMPLAFLLLWTYAFWWATWGPNSTLCSPVHVTCRLAWGWRT
jgi:hypothetical protein